MDERGSNEATETVVEEAIQTLSHADPESREAGAAEEIVYPADETNEG